MIVLWDEVAAYVATYVSGVVVSSFVIFVDPAGISYGPGVTVFLLVIPDDLVVSLFIIPGSLKVATYDSGVVTSPPVISGDAGGVALSSVLISGDSEVDKDEMGSSVTVVDVIEFSWLCVSVVDASANDNEHMYVCLYC